MSVHVRVMYFDNIYTHFLSHIESPISPSLPWTYLSLFSFTFFSPMTFTDKKKYRIVEHIIWSTPVPTISCKKWRDCVLYELMKLYHVHTPCSKHSSVDAPGYGFSTLDSLAVEPSDQVHRYLCCNPIFILFDIHCHSFPSLKSVNW